MPVVPYVSQPRVGLAPLPGARINPGSTAEAFGGGIASQKGTLGDLSGATGAATRIMQETARIQDEEKQRADQVAVTDAATQYVNYRTQAKYNPENGWANARGKDAFDLPHTVMFESDSVAKVIRAGLASDDQRAYFDKIYASQREQLNGEVQQHVAKERAVYEKETTQGAVDAQHDLAVKSFDDPHTAEPAITAIAAIVRKDGERNGMAPDWIDHQVGKAVSQTRFAVLQQMVDTRNDMAAQAYLSQHKDELMGPDLVRAETLVKHGSIEGEGIRQADAIAAAHPRVADEEQAYAEAAKITDPQVREKTEQRLSLTYNRKAAALRASQQADFDTGYKMLRDHGWDLSAVPLSLRDRMGTMHDENLRRASEHELKVARDGPLGDPEQFQTLLNEAYFNPEQFAARNILEAPGLDTKQKNRLQSLQRTVGLRVQRDDEKSIIAGMTATTKAIKAGERPAADTTHTGALDTDASLNAALGIGPKPPAAQAPAPHIKATPQMLEDIAKKGPAYAKYLRSMGVDAPLTVPTEPATPKAKAKKP